MSDQEKLEQARQLLQQNRTSEARAILQSIPNNPTARSWLDYMNQTSPPPASQHPGPGTPPPGQPGQPAPQQQYMPPGQPAVPSGPRLPLLFRQEVQMGVAGAITFLAIIIIGLFFFVPVINLENLGYVDETREALEEEADNSDAPGWQRDDARAALEVLEQAIEGDYEDTDFDVGIDDMDFSAWEIWTGNSSIDINEEGLEWDGNFTLSAGQIEETVRDAENTDNPQNQIDDFGGFGQVRLIDRFLILFPIGALTIIVLAVLYTMKIMKPLPALLGITGVFAFMVLLIFAWQSASTANWRGTIDDEIDAAIADVDEYNTDLETRIFLRVARDDLLETGEDYVERLYNTAPLKVFLILGLIASGTASALTYKTQLENPDLKQKMEDERQARKAQKAQQAGYQQAYYPNPQQQPGTPPPGQMPGQMPQYPPQQPPGQTPPQQGTPPPPQNWQNR